MRRQLAGAVARRSRAAKVEWLRQRIKPGSSVLVVGATVKKAGGPLGVGNMVERGIGEFANLQALVYEDGDPQLDCPVTVGDARALPFDDASFDYVFSNAVIEHVGGPEGARRMLAESVRVARLGAFHTTPDRWFPVEVHTQLPLLHWLPRRWQPGAFARVGREWPLEHYWLFGRRELAGLDGRFRVERSSRLTLMAVWDGA